MARANKAQDAMNEKPEDGRIEEEKKGGDSDIDSEEEAKGQPNAAAGEGEEISIEGKVDAIFEATDSNKDGVLTIAEAKPII